MTIHCKKIFAAAFAVACVASFGCNKEKSTVTTANMANCQAGSELPPDQVLAEWNGGQIKAGEVDKEIDKQLKQIDEEARKQKFDLRRQYLDRMIIDRLVTAQAKEKGMVAADGGVDQNKWVEQEIESKVTPPTEEEMQQFFTKVQGQLPPGTTFEMVKDRLAMAMKQQSAQEKAGEVFENLKKQAGVKIKYEEPRKNVEAKGPSRGPDNAKVTIVEFSDFECPFCGRAKTTVDKVMEDYAGKVKLVFRQFPLPMHPHAPKAAEAALCAADQGKFWEMHDQLFANQKALDEDKLPEYAKAIGLDEAKFKECLASGQKQATIKADTEAGEAAGVSGTPAFFINGRFLNGAVPESDFKKIIDEELQGS